MKTTVIHGPIYEPNSHGNTCRNLGIALFKAGVPVKFANCPSGIWNNFQFKVKRDEAELVNFLEQVQLKAKEYYVVNHTVPNQFIYDVNAALNIGYVSFETDGIPPEWVLPMQGMDCLWTPSFFNLNAFRKSGINKNIYVVPHGVDREVFCETGNKIDYKTDGIKFGCCFDWTPRKNGLNTIGCFLHAMAGRKDVSLVLKVYFKQKGMLENLKQTIAKMRLDMKVGENPKVIILPEVMADYEMGDFYRSIDCLIAIPYGEGFCKPVLEAMACGVPSIVSGWGGQMDFCTSTNSLWVADCPIGPVFKEQIDICGPAYRNQNWCYPNNEMVIQNIKWFVENYNKESVKSIKEVALKTADVYDWKNIANHIIQDILNGY